MRSFQCLRVVGMAVVFAMSGASCSSNPPEADCGNGKACRSGRCGLTVPGGAFPPGTGVKIDEQPTPTNLATDSTQPFVCVVTMSAGLEAKVPLRLTMFADKAAPNTIVFRSEPAGAVGIDSALTTGPFVEALISTSGEYGATARAEGWKLDLAVTNDPISSADTPSLLRNLSLQGIWSAFYDGTRLYVGNGPRILIYDGIPSSPTVKPKIVLGQPELDKIVPGTSASIARGMTSIWSDGKKLVASDMNRVLVWNTVPTTSFAPADLVLGQQDFASSEANVGGVSASTMSMAQGVDSDGTRLVVSDLLNHRVLIWDAFPTTIGQPATSVIGQPSFSTNDVGVLYQPQGVVLDGAGVFTGSLFSGSAHFPTLSMNVLPDFFPLEPSVPTRVRTNALSQTASVTRLPNGGLAMMDKLALRVVVHRQKPTTLTPVDFVLGQPDGDRSVRHPVSGSSLTYAAVASSANGVVLIPDRGRLLVYDQEPRFHFDPAQRVVGQAGFSVNDRGTDYRRISERSLASPADVAVRDAHIAVADSGNNRVVLYNNGAGIAATNASSSIVLGQPNHASFIANGDQVTPSATTMSGPSGVALDGSGRLIVADSENHRVLVWSSVPTTSGTPATFVLGQSDFSSGRPNRGRGDANGDGYSDAAADGMFYPTGVASDGAHLFVADRLNHRILVWDNLSTLSNGKPADRVIGQADFSGVRANRGSAFIPRLDGLNLPTGVTLAGTTLWIADTENNRLVRYDNATTTAAVPAQVVGQPHGTALTNPNYYPESSPNVGSPLHPPTTSSTVLRPRSVAVLGDALYVSETDSHRVHIFDRSGAGTYAHHGQLGQASESTATLNANGISAASLAAPRGITISGTKLYVADHANHRVLAYEVAAGNPPSNASPASTVLGQPSFVANGFNQAVATSAGGATHPRGMALSQGELFVSEASRHRILVHELPLVPGKAPKRIIGQADLSVSLPNAGSTPSATSLSSPHGAFADDTRVIIADTANNRVLVYPRTGVQATLVLGQDGFTQAANNRGGAAGANTMSGPEAVFTDGQKLVVADSGNHRVLVWNTFPTQNGHPADVVIGQQSFAGSLSNTGTGIASASTLAWPSAVHLANGKLFIADTGNNRVLAFDAIPTAAGAAASTVLGQLDFISRIPTADINDPIKLAGPVALVSDGANLYVSDRDTNRVVAFTLSTLTNGARAAEIFSANSGLVATGPAGLAVERTPLFTSRLYVADTNKDQLLVLNPVSRLR